MARPSALLLIVAGGVGVASAAPVPKLRAPTFGEANTNEVVKKHKDKLAAEASTEWQGYPIAQVYDGKPETVWYSASGDSPTAGKAPTVTLTFPEDVTVKRVTVLGSRDPANKDGYFVVEGTIELLDRAGKSVSTHDLKAVGEQFDFDLKLDRFATVRAVRFTATKDQQRFNCVALSEIQVE